MTIQPLFPLATACVFALSAFTLQAEAKAKAAPAAVNSKEATLPSGSMLLLKDAQLAGGKPLELPLTLEAFAGKQVRLRLKARIDWPSLGGSTQAIIIDVNGQKVEGRRLINKPLRFTMRDGTVLEWGELERGTYRLMYSPDFSNQIKEEETFIYGLPEPEQDPFVFLWDITPYVQPGENSVKLSPVAGMSFTVFAEEIVAEVGEPMVYHQEAASTSRKVTPAPTGPLETYAPKTRAINPGWSAKASPRGNIHVAFGELAFTIGSRISLPAGQWSEETEHSQESATAKDLTVGTPFTTEWQTDYYRVTRTVTRHAQRLAIKETIVNTSDKELGVILEHRLQLPEAARSVRLAGRELKWMKKASSAVHPTVLAEFDKLAIGMAQIGASASAPERRFSRNGVSISCRTAITGILSMQSGGTGAATSPLRVRLYSPAP